MVVTPYLPHRRVGHGGGSAVRDLVKHLALKNEVLLVSLVRPGEQDAISEVEELGIRVAPIGFQDANTLGLLRINLVWNRAQSWLRSLFSGFPHYVEKYWSEEVSRQIIALASEFKPQAIQIEYLQMSLFARDLQQWRHQQGVSPLKIVLNTHELGSIPRLRQADQASSSFKRKLSLREAARWERLQVEASRWADTTLCVTPEDEASYTALGGVNLLTVPLGMDLDVVLPDHQPVTPPVCLFVGSFQHRPNVLAAELLVQKIWPLVRAMRADVKLVLAGRGSEEFLANQTKTSSKISLGIEAHGFVDDLTPLFRQCQLFVAPLPEGGGIKIKILEAMARGIPVITTEVGAEGITNTDDDCIIITDHGDAFAQAVLAALNDPQTENRALRARQHMEKNFSWKAITDRLMEIYASEGPQSNR